MIQVTYIFLERRIMMYKKDYLREYIECSELRIYNDKIKVRLSKELAVKYDNGSYNNYFKNIERFFNMIEILNIKYPGNAEPVLYIYIVPDSDYTELLNIPIAFDDGTGGGKPVNCYDLEGFNWAYGITQNMCENVPENIESISKIENEIHELSHIIHSQFFMNNSIIAEGFAETLPLYALGLEDKYDEHRNALKKLNKKQIFSAKEVLISEENNTYGEEELIPDKSCSFRLSYISSYLFVRGCITIIEEKFSLNRIEAIQKFLEIIRQSKCTNEYLIFDIADILGISRDILLNSRKIQIEVLKSL